MNHLLRELAPITADTWDLIDAEAVARSVPSLGARQLVDFSGPLGWEHSATSLGRVGDIVPAPVDGVEARRRTALPLSEVRVRFSLARHELDDATRGAVDVDLSALDAAVQRMASLENRAVFHGWDQAGIHGIIPQAVQVPSAPRVPVPDGHDATGFAAAVAAGVAALKRHGVAGPYGLAVDDDTWAGIAGGSDAGGAPLVTHVERVLGGPIVTAPGLDQAVVVSLRGGDFILEVGQDLSIGYLSHTAESVELYLEETFSFRVATPEAAVAVAPIRTE
jgi:uncharacterized linocin/CFP29 family protein